MVLELTDMIRKNFGSKASGRRAEMGGKTYFNIFARLWEQDENPEDSAVAYGSGHCVLPVGQYC